MNRVDYRLERWINSPAGSHPVLDASMKAVATWGEAAFIGIVIVWFLFGWLTRRTADRRGAITAVSAAGLALLANQVIIHLWERPRPFVAHPDTVHVLLAHASDPSFPSDHASPAFAIAIVVLWFHRRLGVGALLLATIMSVARVYVGDHYPGDVTAGAIVGLIAAIVLVTWLSPVMVAIERAVDRVLTLAHLIPRASSQA